MADILHRIGVTSSSPDEVYAALTTLDGLSGWWARDTTGETAVGGVIAFRFGPGGFDMKVTELVSRKKGALGSGRRPGRVDRHGGKLRAQPGR